MTDIVRSGGNHRMSNVVSYNGVLYLAGQVPTKVDAGITEQTQEVLSTIDGLLKEHGSSKDRILSCQIFLSDMRLFSKTNEVWDSWVVQGHAPARATVEAKLASPEKLIEICVIAAS